MQLWNVAGGFSHFENILQKRPRYGIISSVFDSLPGLKWNGGRLILHPRKTTEEAASIVNTFNSIGIGFNFTFSNTALEEVDLDDADCNDLLQKCYNSMNGVIIGVPLMYDYIKSTFPKFRTIASICQCFSSSDEIVTACSKYDIVAINPDFNKDINLLNRLPKEQIEVLVNEYCAPNCRERKAHYYKLSKALKDGTVLERDLCFRNQETSMEPQRTLYLTKDEIAILEDIGISHFKIQGRQSSNFMEIEQAMNTLW